MFNDIVNTCRRFYLQQMLMVGNFILESVRFFRTACKNMYDLARPYILMAYDSMGIEYPRSLVSVSVSPWHLIVSIRHPEIGELPAPSSFEHALNSMVPAKTNDLLCKYGDIPMDDRNINIDDVYVEIMNGDGEVQSFRGDDIINRF
jgi:hypothetical protein